MPPKRKPLGICKRPFMHALKRVLISGNQDWKAEIFRRPDGTFGLTPLRWSDHDKSWIPLSDRAESVTATLEAAEREARDRIPELADALAADA